MAQCMLCPRKCGVDRETNTGACNAPFFPYVARAALHRWEEPCISGERGSGAIFFCGCNLRCVFCQNYEISRGAVGRQFGPQELAELMLRLEAAGAHNINLVSPAPFVEALVRAIPLAKERGLSVPIVYNTNSYETVEALKRLEGLVDIYLPDLKYVTPATSLRYSGAADYFEFAAPAINEMLRQRGTLKTGEAGMAQSGVLIRHLVLPGSVDETRRVLDYIAENLPSDTVLSLMSQYVPCHRAAEYPPLDRPLLRREYRRAVEYCAALGLERVYIQGHSSAKAEYTPAFDGITV